MTQFHAVLVGEDGMEFGADCTAADHQEAWNYFSEQYPESRVVQVEDPADAAAREQALYARISDEYDGDYFEDEFEDFED